DLSLLLPPLFLAAEWLCKAPGASTSRRVLVIAIGLLFLSPVYLLLQRLGKLSALFWAVALLAIGLSLAMASRFSATESARSTAQSQP
ncbi:MAG TPA: hypothetical protein VKT29_13230, partial [Terriglobales bacterium]|nr:hypothetical protein [Terriglobales bacterium]